MKYKFMFDTNVFDTILDGKIDVTIFPDNYEIFVTHIQRDEIEAINKPEKKGRKEKLLEYFKKLKQNNIPTESAVYGVSKYGGAKYTSDNNLIEELRKGNLQHTKDALIGETAIKNNFILVTNDSKFLKRVCSLGGKAVTFDHFIQGKFHETKN